jgi:CRISPR-associated protein Csx10
MKKIKLKITALSPLAIAAKKPGSVSEVEDHIPGSVIRGAVASEILKQYEQQFQDLSKNGGDFQTLFLSDQAAIFQNAYPAVATVSQKQDNAQKKPELISQVVNEEIMVLPATAVSSKTDSGFKPKGNGVFDTLIDRFFADIYNLPYDPSCPQDLGRVEPFSGFYSKSKDDKIENKYRSHSVSTRFLTRVGINRQRATSQDDILYSIEVLNESFAVTSYQDNWQPVVYSSAILIENKELATDLVNFINHKHGIFRLGSATSRGLGKVQIEAEVESANSNLEVKNRIEKFNDKILSRYKDWLSICEEKIDWLENRTYFTINLQSDAILSEKWQRTTVISPTMLSEFLDLEKQELPKLEIAYSSYNYRAGWNSAWGLMKDIELVTNRGGVYLFSVDKNQEQSWIDKLTELESRGVGERTCEGFGQVQICNEFHLVMREEFV